MTHRVHIFAALALACVAACNERRDGPSGDVADTIVPVLEDARRDVARDVRDTELEQGEDSPGSDGAAVDTVDADDPEDTEFDVLEPDAADILPDTSDAHLGEILPISEYTEDCQCADDRAHCVPNRTTGDMDCRVWLTNTSCEESPCPPAFPRCDDFVGPWGFPELSDVEFSQCGCYDSSDPTCIPRCPGGDSAECPGDLTCWNPDGLCTLDVASYECGADPACDWREKCVRGTCDPVDFDSEVVRVPVSEWPERGFEPRPCHSTRECAEGEVCADVPVALPGGLDGRRWWAECAPVAELLPEAADCPDDTFSFSRHCVFAFRACTIDQHCYEELGEFCEPHHGACAR